jgi:hypothetical protein
VRDDRKMVKIAFAAAFVWAAVVAPHAPTPAPSAGACIPAAQCCKICDEGQAGGKTCISRNKTCHVGRGCACNAAEVCAN